MTQIDLIVTLKGYVIGISVHMYVYIYYMYVCDQKKLNGILVVSHSQTLMVDFSSELYRLALLLHALSALSKSRISLFDAYFALFV